MSTHVEHAAGEGAGSRFGAEWPLPAYATAHSAGMDLRAALDAPLLLPPGEAALVPSGLAIHVADPACARCCCRVPGWATSTASCWATAPA